MGLSVGRQWVLCAGVCWREPMSNAAGEWESNVGRGEKLSFDAVIEASVDPVRNSGWIFTELSQIEAGESDLCIFALSTPWILAERGRNLPVSKGPPFGPGQFLEREVAVRHQQSEGKKGKHLGSEGWFGWLTTVSAPPGSYCTSATLGLWLSYKKNQTKMNNRISQPN